MGWKFEGMPRRTQIGRQTLQVLGIAALALMLHLAAWGQAKPSIPSHGKLSPLFNGKNFTGFDTLLRSKVSTATLIKSFRLKRACCTFRGRSLAVL